MYLCRDLCEAELGVRNHVLVDRLETTSDITLQVFLGIFRKRSGKRTVTNLIEPLNVRLIDFPDFRTNFR